MHPERTDAELVAELHRHGGPLSGRQVMRLLGVGTSKAARLIRLAGWAPPEPPTRRDARDPQHLGPLNVVTDLPDLDPHNDANDQHKSTTTYGSTR